jgi:serine/threonine protein kinase
MAAITCPSDEDLLPSASEQTTSGEVRRHLSDCARCRERLEQLRKARSAPPANGDDSPNRLTPTLEWTPVPVPAASEREQPPAAPTATIGKYRVLSLLAQSGQADVFLAFHPTLHKEVVIKLSRFAVDAGREERTAMLREGRLMADLDLPGMARVYDLDFDGDRPFLVMEHIRGRNLKQYAEEERPSPRQSAVLLGSLARTLETVHARGITHRDIKPHNIIVDETGRPHWIDFGLAKMRPAEESGFGVVTGTPAYMAPEQARGQNERLNSRSDIFSLGGVLFFLLTGKPPFTGNSLYEVLQRAARCEWDHNALRAAGAPRPLERLCEWAMSANPEERPTAGQVAARLEAFATRPRRFLALAAIVLLLMLGALVWWGSPWISPTAASGEAALEVQVWRGQQSYHLLDALPLRSDDELQVLGRVPRGFESVLFWFDTEGRLQELPLETTTAGDGTHFRYPTQKKAVGLIGPPGTEVLLVCARRSGRVDAEEIRTLFADRVWPQLPAHSLLVLDRRQVRMMGSRAPGQLTDRPNSGIVEQAEALRSQLAARLDLVAAVAFPHHK